MALGWLVCSAGLYTHMAFLELYWNFINWTPMYDLPSLFAAGGMVGGLVGLFFLSRVPSARWLRVFSLLICLALLAIGIALAFPEPVQTEGLLARVAPSPAWFRLLRLLLLTIPILTWPFVPNNTPHHPAPTA